MNNDTPEPTAEPKEYRPRPTRKERKSPRVPLPPSTNTDFWGPDAVMAQYNPNTMGAAVAPVHGNFTVEHGFVVCGMCAGNHTVPVDLTKYAILDGRIVKRTA